jgi:hypothetical protein
MARSLTDILLHGMKMGGGVTGTGCSAELETAHPWRGEAGVALDDDAKPPPLAPCFGAGGGRKVGWAKRPNGPVGCWADWAKSQGKFLLEIK